MRAGAKSTVAGKTMVPSAAMDTFWTAAVPLALASFWETDDRQESAWPESDASVTMNQTSSPPQRP
jgi:hypothetical protein